MHGTKSLKTAFILFLGWFLFTMAGCVTMYRPEFRVTLTRVDRTLSLPEAAPPPQTASGFHFEDDWLTIEWTMATRELAVMIRNRTPDGLQVRWDRARFIAVDGTEHRLIDRDVPFSERDRAKPALALSGGTTTRALLYPADFLHWEKGKVVDFLSTPLLPQMPGIANESPARAEAFARSQIGRTLAIRLPIESRSVLREYVFTFTLQSFHLAKILAT